MKMVKFIDVDLDLDDSNDDSDNSDNSDDFK